MFGYLTEAGFARLHGSDNNGPEVPRQRTIIITGQLLSSFFLSLFPFFFFFFFDGKQRKHYCVDLTRRKIRANRCIYSSLCNTSVRGCLCEVDESFAKMRFVKSLIATPSIDVRTCPCDYLLLASPLTPPVVKLTTYRRSNARITSPACPQL